MERLRAEEQGPYPESLCERAIPKTVFVPRRLDMGLPQGRPRREPSVQKQWTMGHGSQRKPRAHFLAQREPEANKQGQFSKKGTRLSLKSSVLSE